MISKIIVLFLFAVIICSSGRIVTNVSASGDNESSVSSSIVTPDKTISYSIKRVREKISLTWLGFFNKKGLGSYESTLAHERAEELIYVCEHDKAQYLETSVSRYITQLGLLSEQFDAKNTDTDQVTSALSDYNLRFEKLRDDFPAQTAQWLLLQQAVDTTNVLASKVHENK